MGSGGSNVLAVHTEGYRGQGINIGFISAYNALATHEAFLEKDDNGNSIPGTSHVIIHEINGITASAHWHDTYMAGIMISSGGTSQSTGGINEQNQIGAAPEAYVHNIRVVGDDHIVSPSNIIAALDELIINQGCRVIVTGIALPTEGDGQNDLWSKIYDYYAQTHDVVFANAAGNTDGGTTYISVFGDGYNGITTGGLVTTVSAEVYDKVGNVSLPGPTGDGTLRQKPDLTAPSSNQTVPTNTSNTSWVANNPFGGYTSYAVPHTAGIAAVLLSYADSTVNELDDNHGLVIKAVLVNSAFPNIDNKSGNPTTGTVWEAQRGYGRLDAQRAYETLSAAKVTAGSSTSQQKGWAYDAIKKTQTHKYLLTGQKNQRLVTTVTWYRKLNSQYTEESTRFYVDMEVQLLPAETVIASQAAGEDNLLKIDTLLPQDGDYQIVVKNAPQTNLSRDYALAFELIDPLPGDFNGNAVVDTNDLASLAQYWLETGCTDPAPCSEYDLSDNNTIDLSDFAAFANQWLSHDLRYYTP